MDAILKSMQVKRIVLTGVVVHNSMDATIRAGKALGYEIILPADATDCCTRNRAARNVLGRLDRL